MAECSLLYRRLAASFLAVAHLLLIVAATPGSTTAAERVLFYHNDALGSPVAMTDAAGSVVWRADYEPFGGIAAEAGTVGNTHQFTGKERDPETGLQYFGARFYDAGIGRSLSVDPALLRGRPLSALQSPQQLNLYAYSANNPYRFIDRDGRFILPLLFALGGALAANAFNPGAVNAPTLDQAPQDLVNSQTTAEFARDTLIGEVIGLGTGKAITAVGGAAVKRVVRSNTAFRYVGKAEAETIENTGRVPNVDRLGNPKKVSLTTEEIRSAAQAEERLRVGRLDPRGPQPSPTHGVEIDLEGVPLNYAGNSATGGAIELRTTVSPKATRVFKLEP